MVILVDEVKNLLVKLRRLLRSRGRTPDDTDDLIQEAFLRMQLYCNDHVVEKAEAFLVRTALNLSADQARRERYVPVGQGLLETLPLIDPSPTPDVVCAHQQRLQRWYQAVARLSPRQREVFLLNRLEGYSYPQIAARLKISTSMVEKHVARAVWLLAGWTDQEDQE